MLLPSMTPAEVHKEIISDYDIITNSSTLPRLVTEYFNSRKKENVAKTASYPLFYEIKSKAKNKWVIKIEKSKEAESFKTYDDCSVETFTYYYSNKGLRVFLKGDSNPIKVFNGHFFTRYQERTGNVKASALDAVKEFFSNNRNAVQKLFRNENDDRLYFTEVYAEGLAMGHVEIIENVGIWFINNTFVGNNTLSSNQSERIEEMKYLTAKKLKSGTIDNSRDSNLWLVAHQVGIMVENKIVEDLDSIIKAGDAKYPDYDWDTMLNF